MKVLFITLRPLEINSSVTISNYGLISGLAELGCDIDILMPRANTNLRQYDPIRYNELKNVDIIRINDNKVYNRLVTSASGKASKFKKILLNLLRSCFYKFSLYDNTIGLLRYANPDDLKDNYYDLVISTSDPKTSHIFASKLIKKGLKYKNWLQHWGDPLTIDITKQHIYPNFLVRSKEKKILAGADFVVYVSPVTAKVQKMLFPEYGNKMHLIPLPYFKAQNDFQRKNDRLTIGYFGDYHSKIRDIEPLYNFFQNHSEFQLIIAGSSNVKLEERPNIKVFPRVNYEMLSDLEEKCDVLCCICNKYGTQIPGKVYYYSATNKPILVLLDGEYKTEIEEYLKKFNRFYMCDNNITSIGEKIIQISKSEISTNPCNAFSPVEIAKEIISLLKRSV